jgi:hypothetical protein
MCFISTLVEVTLVETFKNQEVLEDHQEVDQAVGQEVSQH